MIYLHKVGRNYTYVNEMLGQKVNQELLLLLVCKVENLISENSCIKILIITLSVSRNQQIETRYVVKD